MPKKPPAVAAKSPRRRDPGRTRARLLGAAVKLFSAHGYHGVSVDRIVAVACVNKRMVYHYFGSKEELYLAALAEVFGRLENVEMAAVDADPDAEPEEKLRRLIAADFEFLDKNPEFARMLLWGNLELGANISEHGERLKKDPFEKRFREIIGQGVAGGVFRKPHNPDHLLINLIGLCFIYYSNKHSLGASIGVKLDGEAARKDRLAQVTDLVFGDLLARK
jgi:TetR/AcrR family transcriptional regulator